MRNPLRLVSLCLLLSPVAVLANENQEGENRGFNIRTLSTRPEMVSGGDVLVRIDVPRSVKLDDVRVGLNGADVTGAFSADAKARTLTGLVVGLKMGQNTLRVESKGPDGEHEGGGDGERRASQITLVNHAITGPVFSGPQETPFFCEIDTFSNNRNRALGLSALTGLPALMPVNDGKCSVVTRVDYLYKTTAGKLLPLPSKTAYPADLASTNPTDPRSPPYIVRIETGTIDRAIYEIAVLHDPIADKQDPSLTHRSAGWNGRLVFSFGGGCINGWYRQGSSTGGVLDDVQIRQGYAVASSSLNVFGNNCSDLLASESMMMVKEHFIEAYGPPMWTIGWGCSGGSYQQHQIGDNYPGLLDGIIPGCSFPEVGFATIQFISDARLLNNYFNKTNPGGFSTDQQQRVTGFLHIQTMPNVSVGAGRITPTEFCGIVPVSMRWNGSSGVRCDVYDHTINVYGRDADGIARRPLDNVGIQYGLSAVNDKTITVDQFLDLNERIGGYGRDANFVGARNVADTQAMRAAYQTGRLTNGGGGLRTMPIIDYRAYNDDARNGRGDFIGDIHVRYHSFSMRERLTKANGHALNQVMLHEDSRYGLYSSDSPVLAGALTKMDKWLENLSNDKSSLPRQVKVLLAKPKDLVESCWTRDATPVQIVERQRRDSGACSTIYPAASSPRTVNGVVIPAASFPREQAGSSIASDIIKCQLKPLDAKDYKVPFTAAQWSRLQSTFSSGVCDWSKPGVEQQGLIGTWISFE